MKYLLFIFCFFPVIVFAQTLPGEDLQTRQEVDSLIIKNEEEGKPPKVFHAEPVFIDLIADLGARKGENALEFGSGYNDYLGYIRYHLLLEYEFVPIDRLGFEIEIPVNLFSEHNADNTFLQNGGREERDGSRINALRTAVQYTFLVSEKWQTSMAIGYLNELKLPDFRDYGRETAIQGNYYNPFLVAAKRFGLNYHTLVLGGPLIKQEFEEEDVEIIWQINSNFHYMIPGTRNFLGIELNKEIEEGIFSMMVRPQIIVNLAENLNLGFTAGIPVNKEYQRMSTFFRVMYDFN
jgi:hypothetical protein